MKRAAILVTILVGAVTAVGVAAATGWVSWREGLRFVAPVGGSFALTAHNGQPFASTTLKGQPHAVFFGFTHCPDICPTTLLEMSNHLQALGPLGDAVRILFVTVDPERDTAEQLQLYLASFDKRIVGLTGTTEDVASVARKYNAYYEKVPTGSGYTMNHASTVYLMGADGRLADTFTFQDPTELQLAKLKTLAQSAAPGT